MRGINADEGCIDVPIRAVYMWYKKASKYRLYKCEKTSNCE